MYVYAYMCIYIEREGVVLFVADTGNKRLMLMLLNSHDHQPSPAVLGDVSDLVTMQPGVHRHGDQAGVPDCEERFEVLGAIPHHDGDAVARLQSVVVSEATGDCSDACAARRPVGVDVVAHGERRAIRPTTPVPVDPHGQVHLTPLRVRLQPNQ